MIEHVRRTFNVTLGLSELQKDNSGEFLVDCVGEVKREEDLNVFLLGQEDPVLLVLSVWNHCWGAWLS